MSVYGSLPQCVGLVVVVDESASTITVSSDWRTNTTEGRRYTTEVFSADIRDLADDPLAMMTGLMHDSYDSAKDHFDPAVATLPTEAEGVRYGFYT